MNEFLCFQFDLIQDPAQVFVTRLTDPAPFIVSRVMRWKCWWNGGIERCGCWNIRWRRKDRPDASDAHQTGLGEPMRQLRFAVHRHEAEASLPRVRKGKFSRTRLFQEFWNFSKFLQVSIKVEVWSKIKSLVREFWNFSCSMTCHSNWNGIIGSKVLTKFVIGSSRVTLREIRNI